MEISRRRLIKNTVAVLAGVATDTMTKPVKALIGDELQKYTPLKSGNAAAVRRFEEQCAEEGQTDTAECFKNMQLTNWQKIDISVIGPFIEEIGLRKFPSSLLGEESNDGILPKKWDLNRRELLLGCATSSIFTLIHNFTVKGFDTEYLHVRSFVSGWSYWYLQRKFGFRANLMAHMKNNYIP